MAVSYKISDKNLKNVWLVLSKDSFVCTDNLRIIENICVKNGIDEDSISYFDVDKVDWNEIFDLVQMPSFFGERLIVIQGQDFTALNDEKIENLAKLASDTGTNHIALIFSYSDDKKIKTKKCESFFATVRENGMVHFVEEIDERYLEDMIIQRAKKMDTVLSKEIARKIVENIGKDVGLLVNEVDKYCAASDYTEITIEIVDKIGIKSVEASVFDMIDLICKKRPALAIEKLNNLFALRTDEISILGALTSSFVDMHRCKLAEKNRMNYTQVNKDFESKAKSYRYQKAMNNASKFTLTALDDIIEMLLKADIAAKTTSQDKKQMLYVLTTQIISKGVR